MQRRLFILSLMAGGALSAPAYAKKNWFSWGKKILGTPDKKVTPSAQNNGQTGALSALDADHGLRQALTIGIDQVVGQLGVVGGFLNDEKIRIPLPKTLRKARKLAKPIGMAGPFDDLQARMNHGAENAMPAGKTLLKGAVRDMSVEDAIGIVRGPDDSATQYLRGKMEPSLIEAFSPIIHQTLSESGAMSAAKGLANRYSMGSYADQAEEKLTRHVVSGALDGSFFYLAAQEKLIRSNPGNYASDIIKRVFGRG